MAPPFPSEDWLEAFQKALNSDEHFAGAARHWEGDVLFLIEADDGGVVAAVYFDLQRGQPRSASFYQGTEQVPQAKFEMRGPLESFRRVLRGEIDPIHAILTRKISIKGSMGYVLRNAQAVLELVRVARSIPSEGTVQLIPADESSYWGQGQSAAPSASA